MVRFYSILAGLGSMTVSGYYWDFGDGNTSTEASPEHIYANGGSYVVVLTVHTKD